MANRYSQSRTARRPSHDPMQQQRWLRERLLAQGVNEGDLKQHWNSGRDFTSFPGAKELLNPVQPGSPEDLHQRAQQKRDMETIAGKPPVAKRPVIETNPNTGQMFKEVPGIEGGEDIPRRIPLRIEQENLNPVTGQMERGIFKRF